MLNTPKKIRDALATGWCQPVRWIGVLAALAIFSLASAPANADDIVAINISNLTFTGNVLCGFCTETLSSSFQYDSTTNTIVPNTMTTASGGVLGIFTFSSTRTFTISGGQKETDFNWQDANNLDQISVFFQYPTELLPGTITQNGAVLNCGIPSCSNDFSNALPTSGTISVSPVPEPSSLLLLGTGLIGLTGRLLRRKKHG